MNVVMSVDNKQPAGSGLSSPDTIMELRQVTKIYRTRKGFMGSRGKKVVALNEVTLAVSRGEIFGLVGESGSGKTTAGRLIVKLEAPDSGRILLNDHDTTALGGKELKSFRRKVQMIFQDPYQSLNAQLSVFDTVAEPLTIHRLGRPLERAEKVQQVLKSVGLSPPEDFLFRFPHQLSGGQRQRVAIARAMVIQPLFVVADEPTSMLDASFSAQIFNILLKMRKELQVTFLFITHSLAAARYLCDRIGVIYRGNLVEIGPAAEVIANPRHPYTQALIDALPEFGKQRDTQHYGTLLRTPRNFGEPFGCPFFLRCKFADEATCRRKKPPLQAINGSHQAACFYTPENLGGCPQRTAVRRN
jgi:peptide/nickel transport system ATP-binding protein